MSEVLLHESENELIWYLNESIFYDIIEDFLQINNFWKDSKKDIFKSLWVFLWVQENRYKFEDFLINNYTITEEEMNSFLFILKEIDNFYNNNQIVSNELIATIVNNTSYKKDDFEIETEEINKMISNIIIKKSAENWVLEYDAEFINIEWKNEIVEAMANYFKIRTNNLVLIFDEKLKIISAYDILIFMNELFPSRKKYFTKTFEKFKNLILLNIWELKIIDWKKYIYLKTYDSKEKSWYYEWIMTDGWDFLFLNDNFINKVFWIKEILDYEFLECWITDKQIDCLLDYNNQPVIVKWKYIRNINKLNITRGWKKFYEINDWEVIISEEDLKIELEIYISLNINNSLAEEIYE